MAGAELRGAEEKRGPQPPFALHVCVPSFGALHLVRESVSEAPDERALGARAMGGRLELGSEELQRLPGQRRLLLLTQRFERRGFHNDTFLLFSGY